MVFKDNFENCKVSVSSRKQNRKCAGKRKVPDVWKRKKNAHFVFHQWNLRCWQRMRSKAFRLILLLRWQQSTANAIHACRPFIHKIELVVRQSARCKLRSPGWIRSHRNYLKGDSRHLPGKTEAEFLVKMQWSVRRSGDKSSWNRDVGAKLKGLKHQASPCLPISIRGTAMRAERPTHILIQRNFFSACANPVINVIAEARYELGSNAPTVCCCRTRII